MKRDMDLIRDLMLKLEEQSGQSGRISILNPMDLAIDGRDLDEIDLHMSLIYEEGFVEHGNSHQQMADGRWVFRRLTTSGYDFLDSVRSPETWKKTKSGAQKLGGWTVPIIRDLASAYIKAEAKARLGLDL